MLSPISEAWRGGHDGGYGLPAFRFRPKRVPRYAERALSVADGLGLDRSARALGFRGLARITLGDHGGVGDMRQAIALATAAGQGREVALLHNNLGLSLWVFDGPAAALEVMRDGMTFARSRGLTEMLDGITAGKPDLLYDLGALDEALDVAAAIATRLEASEAALDLIGVRAAHARSLALRGRAGEAAGWLG
jgi:hypothetical protein